MIPYQKQIVLLIFKYKFELNNENIYKGDAMYTIKMSKKQIGIMQEALEMYSRHLAGQFNYSILPTTIEILDFDRNKCNEKIIELKNVIFPNLHSNESYGIGGDHKLKDPTQIAYEMYKMILYQFEKDSNFKNKYSVHSSLPLHYSNEKFIEIEKIDE